MSDNRQMFRDQLARPDGLAELKRMMADAPPLPIERAFESATGAYVRAVVSRRWRQDRPGVRTPEPHHAQVEITAGDYATGPEFLTPAEARQTAAALLAAADWVEAQR